MRRQLTLASALVLALGGLLANGCQETTVRGPGGKAMTVHVPLKPVRLQRTHTQTLEVTIVREGFADTVAIDLVQLPGGVTTANGSQRVQTDKATFVLTASDKAGLVTNHRAKVVVTGPDGMAAVQYVAITVTE